jgi:large subunit ribosomal protein L25
MKNKNMTLNLNVKNREKKEKIEGMMPAVMYGANAKTTSIFIDKIEFKKVLKNAGESTVVALTGDHNENVLIHDVQIDPVAYVPIHADLYIVEKGQKVHVNLPIRFIGEAPATKLGANIVKVLQEISIEADPSKLPQDIEVDLSKLVDLQSNITVGDIVLPAGATLFHITKEDVVASVVSQSDEDLDAAVEKIDMDSVARAEKVKKEEVAAE